MLLVLTLYLNILHSTECSVKTRRGDAKIGRDKFKESGPVGRRERGPNLEPSVAITVSWDGDDSCMSPCSWRNRVF